MNTSRRSCNSLFRLALLFTITSIAAYAQVRTSAVARARINQKIDNTQRTTLAGHLPRVLANAQDQGRVDGEQQVDHMVMVLRRGSEQQHELTTLLDEQQNKNHVNYRKWMTPTEFGAHFGVAESDLATLRTWMEAQGLTVEQVVPGNMFLMFGGKVNKIEAAFGTEFHKLTVNGEAHVSATINPSVPTALTPVIKAIPTLHNFFKKPYAIKKGAIQVTPQYTSGGGSHYFGPGDFATIYNTKPLLANNIDGTGVSIGVIGRTDINLEDVQAYRTLFNLKQNDPVFTIAGQDPGVVPGDDGESYLDVEVSGGVAPGASINFVTSRSSPLTDGVDLSALYVVVNDLTDIITESYGQCEYYVSYYGNDLPSLDFERMLWEQAAAQGISVFVSSGDNGPAACDSAGSSYSSNGYAVSGLASTPYNVAVGGTMFSEGTGTYWNSTNAADRSSAISYIAETPWNEAKGSGAAGAGGLWSGSGGVSAYFERPSWQRGPGIDNTTDPVSSHTFTSSPTTPFTTGLHRLLPDVSLNAAGSHDGTLYCAEGICQINSDGGLYNAGLVGGTSVAAPEMAGVQALVNQQNGGRQGMPGYAYYSLAAAQTTSSCASSSSTTPTSIPDASCVFNDMTTGDILVCGNTGCTTKLGWTAGAGYDLATGLGSVNAYNLATKWSTVTFTNSSTTLSLSQTTGIKHGDSITFTVQVAPGSGSEVPTGDVSFITSTGLSVGSTTLINGSRAVSANDLPAGTYTITARYSGDVNFGSSSSLPIEVTVAPEANASTVGLWLYNSSFTQTSTFTYGGFVWVDMEVSGATPGTPTGTLTILDNNVPLTTATLNSQGNADLASGVVPSGYSGYVFTNVPTFAVGTHTLAVNYSGDSTFASGTGTITFTVNKATPTGTLRSNQSYITASSPVTVTMMMTAVSGGVLPTGNVTFYDGTTALGTASLIGDTAALSTTAITTDGAHSVTATYNGDGNYNTMNSSAVTVTVGTGTTTSVTLTSSANPWTIGTATRPTLTATITPSAATGSVSIYDGLSYLGSCTLSGGICGYTPTAAVLTGGTHSFTANYVGTSSYSGSVSTALTEVVNKLTPAVQLTARTSGDYNANFTFSAALSGLSSSITPTGTVQFYDGATALGVPQPLSYVSAASGGYGIYRATYATTSLQRGSHTVTAVYSGDTTYNASTSNVQTVAVPQLVPTLTWASPSAITYGTSLNGVMNASATYSNAPLAGSFAYSADGTPVTGATLLDVGSHSLQATFTPTDTTNYVSGGTVQVTLVVNKVDSSMSVSKSSPTGAAVYGTPVTISASVTPSSASGSVSFTLDNGTASAVTISGGVATFTYPLLSGGNHSVTASYSGDSDYNVVSGSTSFSVATYTPTVTVTTSLQNSGTSQSVTFTAAVPKATGGTAPTGNVTFKDGTTVLGSSGVDATGMATYTASSMTAGTHAITAIYVGDGNYSTSASAALTQTVVTTDYSITATPTTITIPLGSQGQAALTATAVGGFNSTLSLSCGSLPSFMSCTTSPQPMTWNNGTSTGTLLISTSGSGVASLRRNAGRFAFFALALPGMLVFGSRKKLGTRAAAILMLMVMLGLTLGLGGCGGGSNTQTTRKGSYTVAVTALGGTTSHSVNLTVVVQ